MVEQWPVRPLVRGSIPCLFAMLMGCSGGLDIPEPHLEKSPCDGTLYKDECADLGLYSAYGVDETCKHPFISGHLRWQGTYRCVPAGDILCCPGP